MREIKQQDYIYGTAPFEHQGKGFLMSRDEEAYALLMEQGTGKTKVGIDTGAWLYITGKIDAIIIVAPNGVHENWEKKEIPTHMPEYVTYKARTYKAGMGKKATAKFNEVFDPKFDGLRIVAFNIDCFSRKSGRELPKKFLNNFRCLFILDESSRIKNKSANRTKAIVNIGKQARYRRILSGTPVTQSPMDVYTQFEFLDPEILGFTSYYSFRGHYGLLETNYRLNPKTGKREPYQVVTGYQNLDKLQQVIKSHSFRVLKKDCLDLPDKIYQTRTVKLSKEQQTVYNDLCDNLYSEFAGTEVSATLVLTKMLRLQQITGGFVTDDAKKNIQIGTTNPKLDELLAITEEISSKAIIWARFVPEIEAITEALRAEYGEESVVTYYGATKKDERYESVKRFQDDPTAKFFVGNPVSGGIGLTLTAAQYMIYYSNDFNLETRLQSEDRAHRIGQKENVTYIDLIAEGTIDTTVVAALLSKKNLADIVTGDKILEVVKPKA